MANTMQHWLSPVSNEIVRLEKNWVHAQQYFIDSEAPMSTEMAVHVAHDLARGLVMSLRGHVYGRQEEPVEFQYPRDWWEHVKLRFAPGWFKRRYPVKMHTVTYKPYAKYPTLHVGGRDHGAYLNVVRVNEPDWSDLL